MLADADRAYTSGADRAVLAYRLADGAPLWSLPVPLDAQGRPRVQHGLAVAAGVVYRSDDGGLTAHAAAGGRRLWTAAGPTGELLVAGGRVLTGTQQGVRAFAAAGCGRSTCAPLWSRALGDLYRPARVGGATGRELFVTYDAYGEPGGRIARLAASTGAVAWTASAGRWLGRPSRGGATVWAFVEYPGRQQLEMGLVGFSAGARGSTPLRFLPLPGGAGAQGGIAVAGGSVLVQRWAGPLLGYRVPGT